LGQADATVTIPILWLCVGHVIFDVMEIDSELYDICAQLQRDAGCRKVMVCGQDGEVLAHAGDRGILDEAASDALAAMVADAMHPQPSENRKLAELPGDLQATLPTGMTACAAALADRAALVVVFDEATTLERVRIKMRRARERLVKSLPGVEDPPTGSTPSKS
jgi:predicted regulator of Ras-like GTPase activity (Roadblock/LC7/MglB family)